MCNEYFLLFSFSHSATVSVHFLLLLLLLVVVSVLVFLALDCFLLSSCCFLQARRRNDNSLKSFKAVDKWIHSLCTQRWRPCNKSVSFTNPTTMTLTTKALRNADELRMIPSLFRILFEGDFISSDIDRLNCSVYTQPKWIIASSRIYGTIFIEKSVPLVGFPRWEIPQSDQRSESSSVALI